MTRSLARAALAIASLALVPGRPMAAQGAGASYRVVQQHNIGGDGGWDYLVVDTVGHRLFVTRSNRVSALDLASGKVLGEMPGLNRGHGVAFDYGRGRGFATSGGDGSVVMFDLATLRELGRTAAAEDADAILYDRASDRVVSLNGDAGSATVIEPASGKRVANVPLGGKPEFAVSDGRGHVFVNIADKGEVAELDPKAEQVIRRWSIAPCEDPSGLAMDLAHARLFSVCRNRLMVVSDASAGRVVTTVPIGAGVDAAAYDPATGDAFASNGEGTLTVVHEDAPDRYHVVQTVPTMTGARTMALDPVTHRLYTLGARYGERPAGARRAPMVPGSATVVVLEPVR